MSLDNIMVYGYLNFHCVKLQLRLFLLIVRYKTEDFEYLELTLRIILPDVHQLLSSARSVTYKCFEQQLSARLQPGPALHHRGWRR